MARYHRPFTRASKPCTYRARDLQLILTNPQIVYHEFPIPRPYANVNRPPSPTQSRADQNDTSQAVGQTPSTPIRNLPPVPLFPNSSATSASHIPDSLPPSQSGSSNVDDLPAALLQLLSGIIATLQTSFIERPPHTIQRLAELVLSPTNHYKTLPAWLRAVDRVVNVSSSADVFPLSEQTLLTNGVNGEGPPAGSLLFASSINEAGTRNGYDSASLGSDESLGGALLTPIPWLRNGGRGKTERESEESTEETTQSSSVETDDDGLGDPISLPSTTSTEANSMGAITTNSDPFVPERPEGAVTQGELIRMEQEAGVVPISANQSGPPPMPSGAGQGMEDDDMVSEGAPHARGPDLVGAVDMGKVEGRNVEVRIGSPPMDAGPQQREEEAGSKESTTEDADYEMIDKDAMEVDEHTGQVKADIVAEAKDKDEDMVLVDAEGRMDDDESAVAPSSTADEQNEKAAG